MTKIVECPRDAWQGLPRLIPTEQKAAYLRTLIEAGFTHIDAASFVSSSAVPQMADAEAVLSSLDVPSHVEMIGIVVNERGAERAAKTGKITTLGYPYSVSPNFLKKNQHQTPQESIAQLSAIQAVRSNAGLGLVVYVSMAFGNPYGDPWSIQQVVNACKLLMDSGVKHISLADTVGVASAGLVADLVGTVIRLNREVEIGVHLHAKPANAESLVRAAYAANCRRFDAAIGGLGGCPFAQEDLVGNMPTEVLIRVLRELKADLPMLNSLDGLVEASARFARDFGSDAC
jgi:hydroxymethylglutaryl-CoA lyase